MPLDNAGGSAITSTSSIERVCAARDAALESINQAIESLHKAYSLSAQANRYAEAAHNGSAFYLDSRNEGEHYKALFGAGFDATKSRNVYRKHLDACVWTNIVDRLGVDKLMDKTAKEDLRRSLLAEVPEVSIDNVRATIESLIGDSDMIFKRGLAVAFSRLDRRFRSHDGFKIGSRVILTRVFDDWGSWNYHADHRATFVDIERVFAVLDGVQPDPVGLVEEINASRHRGLKPHQSETESRYFRIRAFKNGNAHLWFTRDDLVEKANKLLAEYYGDVIPDAMTKDATAEDLRNRPGLPAKKLQFYPTPQPVVDALMNMANVGPRTRVLEPSAGTGNIAKAARATGASVNAVEIDPGRASQIEALCLGIGVMRANFLQLIPTASYDVVLMNPPFYGTHWADHVMHAFDFLVPGGKLYAVLPASAEIGDTKRHHAFHAWLKQTSTSKWGWDAPRWRDLPAESFAESGTRVHTVILELSKGRDR